MTTTKFALAGALALAASCANADPAASPGGLSCTLMPSATTIAAGGRFTMRWSIAGAPTLATFRQDPNVLAGRELPGGSDPGSTPGGGSKQIRVGAAGSYSYTLTVSSKAATSTCSTRVRATGMPALPTLPIVTDRIGLAAFFLRAGDSNAGMWDVAWTGDGLLPQLVGQYIPFDREPFGDPVRMRKPGTEQDHTVSWFLANHPDWIEYKADKTLGTAYVYKDANGKPYSLAPLDITNPAVRQYIWDRRVAPSIMEGYRMISFDNVFALNVDYQWGVNRNGTWVRQFTPGTSYDIVDPAYVHAVQGWLDWMRTKLHQNGTLLTANLGGFSSSNDKANALFLDTATHADMVLAENAFIGNDAACGYDAAHFLDAAWLKRFTVLQTLAQRQPLIFNNECFGHTANIPKRTVNWVVANYLLARGTQTYLQLVGDDDTTNADKNDLTELHAPVGAAVGALEQSGVLWTRRYKNGVAIVNPSSTQSGTFSLEPGRYHDLAGTTWSGAITVPPATGVVLIKE